MTGVLMKREGPPSPVEAWHKIVASRDPAGLGDLLAEEIVFRSPAVHAPAIGRDAATTYLTAALVVLGPSLAYHRQWWDEHSAVLEFETTVDGRAAHGVDLLEWDQHQRITEFTVIVRPLRGLEVLVQRMGEELRSPRL